MANTKGNKVYMVSEDGALDYIQRALFGKKVKLVKASLIHDNLAEVNSPYDCSEGSRKVAVTLSVDEKEYNFHIVTTRSVTEAQGEYGEVIGSDSYSDSYIEFQNTDFVFQKMLWDGEEDFADKMPNLSYDFSNELDRGERIREEEIQLRRMEGEEHSCTECQKKFVFTKETPYDPQQEAYGVNILPFCSDKCCDKFHADCVAESNAIILSQEAE